MELLHLALEPIGSRAKCNNSTARAIILTNALHSVHYPYQNQLATLQLRQQVLVYWIQLSQKDASSQ